MDNIPENVNPTRGEITRQSLITTAIAIFGRDGFDAASTRAIAKAAGVNQALIGYHFGGKPGLYAAALQHIAENISARIGPLLNEIESDLSAETGSEHRAGHALELLHRLTDVFVQVLNSDESADRARLILHEQQYPSEGFDILYHGFMHRMFSTTTHLVSLVRGEKKIGEQTWLMAATILGQALVFRAGRTVVMRELGWSKLELAEIEKIKALLRNNVTALLTTEQTS
jgi:AcrR family transcriptional regulator